MISDSRMAIWKVILSLGVVIALLSTAGCDMLFGDDDDDEGTLTVWIRDAESHNPCPPDGKDTFVAPLAIIWVYPSGVTEGDGYVAFGAWGFGPHPDDPGEIVSRIQVHERDPHDDPNQNPVWRGRGGRGYDVYPTVYCAPLNEPTDPGSGPDGDQIDLEDDLVRVYMDTGDPEGWGVPITYTKDGNKTITIQAADFVEP